MDNSVNGSSKAKRNKTQGGCTKLDRTDGLRRQGREQGKSRLNCIYFNAKGLTGKADELRA